MNIEDLFARKIIDELNLDESQYEIIRYGAFAFIQIILSILAVAFFGFVFGVMIEALMVSLSTSILRQYSGGVHASEPTTCLIIGTTVSVGLAIFINFISGFLNLFLILGILPILFLISFYIICKNAPVDSKAKPIRTEMKRRKLKKISFAIISVYLIVNIIFLLLYLYSLNTSYYIFSLDVCGGMLFQIFSLTIIGHEILAKVDNMVTRVLYWR